MAWVVPVPASTAATSTQPAAAPGGSQATAQPVAGSSHSYTFTLTDASSQQWWLINVTAPSRSGGTGTHPGTVPGDALLIAEVTGERAACQLDIAFLHDGTSVARGILPGRIRLSVAAIARSSGTYYLRLKPSAGSDCAGATFAVSIANDRADGDGEPNNDRDPLYAMPSSHSTVSDAEDLCFSDSQIEDNKSTALGRLKAELERAPARHRHSLRLQIARAQQEYSAFSRETTTICHKASD